MGHPKGYIIIDTEGTGLFKHKNPDGSTRASDAPGQPRMAEFAAVLADKNLDFQDQYQAYIRPEGWLDQNGDPLVVMPQGAFDVHGLSMEFLHDRGIPVTMALAIYVQAIKDGRAVLGFNQQHDGRQVRAELRHAGLYDMFEQTQTVCAMRSIAMAKIKVEKLNGKAGWPRLVDAAAHFNIDYPEDVRHSALEDASLCRQIGWKLNAMGVLLPAEIHYAKDYSGVKEVQS